MTYKLKQAKRRRDAMFSTLIILTLAGAYGAYKYITRPAVHWANTEFRIPEFRDADANLIGRTFELIEQQALDVLIRETVEEAYRKNKNNANTGYLFATIFDETFHKELKITIEVRDKSGEVLKTHELRLKRSEDLPGKVAPFAREIITNP